MNRLVHLAILCCIFGLVSSCEKDPFLSLNSPNTITFSEQGGTQKVSFTTNRDWTVSSSESWCMVSPSSGLKSDGDVSLTITCGANPNYDSRSATVTIKVEELVESITVNQDTKIGFLVDKWTYRVDNSAHIIPIEVQSNVEYFVDIEESSRNWISLVKTKSLSTNIIELSVAANNTHYDRKGQLIIKQIGGDLTETIIVMQDKSQGILVASPEYKLSNSAQTLNVEVQSDVEYDVESLATWIKFVETKALSSSTIVLSIDANESYDSRTGTVLVKQTNGDQIETITITQSQTNGIFVTPTEFNLDYQAQSVELDIRNNVPFTISIPSDAKDWISIQSNTTTKALTNDKVILSIAQNESDDDREAYVTIKQNDGPLVETVKIAQGHKDKLSVAKDKYAISYKEQQFEIDVVSNVDYSISTDVDWLSVSNYGSSSASYTVSVLENKDDTHHRVGHIVLSQIDGDLRTEVNVAQDRTITGLFYSKEPQFSEGVELISLIWRFIDASEYNDCRVQIVNETADAFFASMRTHEVFNIARELRYQNHGAGYDACASFGLSLLISNDGLISFNPFYKDVYDPYNRFPNELKVKLLASLNDFYKKSNFHEWYESLEPLRQQAIDIFKTIVDVDYKWFDLFYGPIEGLSTQVILGFLNGRHNYGCSFDLSYGGRLLSPVLGCIKQDKSGISFLSDMVGTLIHEFSHPYCNPLIDKYWESMKDKANSLFPEVESLMRSMAYTDAKIMMYETLVRACTIRYLITHGYSKNKESLIKIDESSGFMMVRSLVDALEIREQNWSKYQTLDDFMPEIVKAINDYQL